MLVCQMLLTNPEPLLSPAKCVVDSRQGACSSPPLFGAVLLLLYCKTNEAVCWGNVH
jgi:hypothetical protein